MILQEINGYPNHLLVIVSQTVNMADTDCNHTENIIYFKIDDTPLLTSDGLGETRVKRDIFLLSSTI